MFLEKHINPDFSLINLGHNLQTIGKSPLNNPFTNGPHFSKHGGSTKLNSANWHVLHICGTSWTLPKYTGAIHGMFVAGVVSKRKGFSSVLILSKKKNHHRTLHLDPQTAGFMVKPNIIKKRLSEVEWAFRNTHLPVTYLFQIDTP